MKERISEGNDFIIERESREFGTRPVEAFKVDGRTGAVTVAGEAIGGSGSSSPVTTIAGGFLPNNPNDGDVSDTVFGCVATAYTPAEPEFGVHWCIVLDTPTPKAELIVKVSVASFGSNPVVVPTYVWQAFDPLHEGEVVLWVGAIISGANTTVLDTDMTFEVSLMN